MRILLSTLFVLLFVAGFGQAEKAKRYIDTLCTPHFFGRGYTHNWVNKASDFLKNELEQKGAKPLFGMSFFQAFEHGANIFIDTTSLSITDNELVLGEDFIPRGSSGSFKGSLPCKNITLPSTLDKGYLRNIFHKNPAGQRVLVVDKANLENAEQGELMITMLANSYPLIITGYDKLTWSVATKNTYFPVFETLLKEVEDKQQVKISVTQEQKLFTSKNVAGYIPAQSPSDSFVFVSAHYDHLGGLDGQVYIPGANDNASGTAMLLDMVDYFKSNPHPKYNIGFLFFAAEEMGLLGSKHYVDNPSIPLEKTVFLLNLDLMGSGDKGFAVVNGSIFPNWLDKLKGVNEQLPVPFETIKVRGEAANSDHYWFSRNNVPAFFIYTMGGSSAYHDINDTPDIITLSRYTEMFDLLTRFMGKI